MNQHGYVLLTEVTPCSDFPNFSLGPFPDPGPYSGPHMALVISLGASLVLTVLAVWRRIALFRNFVECPTMTIDVFLMIRLEEEEHREEVPYS